MKVNITAGECLNRILEARYPGGCFVPFNEAMNQGTCSAPLFSEEFVRERAAVHGVSEAEYLEKLFDAGARRWLDWLTSPVEEEPCR